MLSFRSANRAVAGETASIRARLPQPVKEHDGTEFRRLSESQGGCIGWIQKPVDGFTPGILVRKKPFLRDIQKTTGRLVESDRTGERLHEPIGRTHAHNLVRQKLKALRRQLQA